MDFTVSELDARLGGQFASPADGSARITGVGGISEAGPGDLTFFADPRYLVALKACKATAVLVPLDFDQKISPIAIQVANPAAAFAKLLESLAPEPIHFPPGVHPSAIIAPDAELGEAVSIQPYVVIESGAKVGAGTVLGAGTYIGHAARVGADCQIAPRVSIGSRCEVGDRAILHGGVVIGSDGFGFEFKDGRHVKIQQNGIVQIDPDVEIGANTTIDRARFGRTWVGEGTKIDNMVQIGHNVVIGKHCIICAQVGISGSTRLGNFVVIGGQAGIIGHITIGDGAQIGAQTGVSKTVPPKAVLWGTPGRPLGEVMEQLARVARLGKLGDRVRKIEQVLDERSKLSSPET